VELLALVRDARINGAQLRAILELSPQARQAIVVWSRPRRATMRGGNGASTAMSAELFGNQCVTMGEG
jgi:hypothetical protein